MVYKQVLNRHTYLLSFTYIYNLLSLSNPASDVVKAYQNWTMHAKFLTSRHKLRKGARTQTCVEWTKAYFSLSKKMFVCHAIMLKSPFRCYLFLFKKEGTKIIVSSKFIKQISHQYVHGIHALLCHQNFKKNTPCHQ